MIEEQNKLFLKTRYNSSERHYLNKCPGTNKSFSEISFKYN